ncbi:hypothetical protein [Streptomyces sp. HUAS ZL42]|uniref:hypothetical protein n=1 Tax=Streptomyces sp. HUAS ZL42 TaxID=3231715 RepID=UPI00345E30DE
MRAGPDGRDAVRAALSELQRNGCLVRELLRKNNGTLGEIVYSVTDRPAIVDTEHASAAGTAFASAAAGEEENWLGEVEGINLTLTFLRAKREETQRRTGRPAVDLGIP